MKKRQTYLYLLLLLFPTVLFAQDTLSNGYIFPEFSDGFVLGNDGSRIAAKLNYSCIDEKMLYMDNDKIMEFGVPESVSIVTIGERCFVNSGTGPFYEEIAAGESFLYVQRMAKVIQIGKDSGYGGFSGTTAITNVSRVGTTGGSLSPLKSSEKIETKTDNSFYLKIKNKFKKINNLKMVQKLYKGQETKIEAFVNEQKIDFSKISDMTKLVEFIGKLNK